MKRVVKNKIYVKMLYKNKSPKTLILVGNKSDLADRKKVNTEEGQELDDKYGMQPCETSAKTA